jgi:hypothetical protein
MDLAGVAHVKAYVDTQLSPINIQDTQHATKAYKHTPAKSIPSIAQNLYDTTVTLEQKTSQQVARELNSKDMNPVILNMANRFVIGGGFESGRGTQEESLFFCSDLYQRLYPHGNPGPGGRYKYDSKHRMAHAPGKSNNAYYTGNVRFFATPKDVSNTGLKEFDPCDQFTAGVITMPAYDLRAHNKHNDVGYFVKSAIPNWKDFNVNKDFDWDRYKEYNKDKIQLMLRMAKDNGHDAVVLGGFGCGAFKLNLPMGQVAGTNINQECEEKVYEVIAASFKEVLEQEEFKGVFKKISFPITDKNLLKKFEGMIAQLTQTPRSHPKP